MAESRQTPLPVLMVVRELGSGGIERDVTKLAKGLSRELFTPYVAAYKPEGARYEELQEAGIPVFHIKLTSLKSPNALYEALRFGRFLKRKRIRLVHAWDASAVFTLPIARLMRVPVVLSSTLGHRDLLDARSRRQVQFTDRVVDAAVVNCEAMRRHLVEDYAVPAEDVQLCYNGVDVSEFYPAEQPRPAAVAGASFVIGTVCVLRVEKALELLVEAFAKVRDKVPGSKLLIVGSGPELPKLQALSEKLAIAQDCVFVPAVRKVAEYLRGMDIFVSTSYSEAFSNSILEAMACGCCVVASRVGGTPELIADEERGLLFQSGNSDDLAQKLTKLIDDPGLRKRFAHNAAEFARTRLSMDTAVARMTEIYEKLLRQKRAA